MRESCRDDAKYETAITTYDEQSSRYYECMYTKGAHLDKAHNNFTHQPAGDDDELLFRTKQTAMKYVSSILIVKVLVIDSRFRGRRERERCFDVLHTHPWRIHG